MYSLDTSAILDGWRRYYPPDVFAPLWEKLDGLIAAGTLRSPDEVREELKRKDDEVWEWARRRSDLFTPLDEQIQATTTEILGEFPRLVDTRRGRGQADPFVIAYARITGAKVVTGERRLGTAQKPTIPFVCRHYGVQAIDLLDLMREQGWTFS